MDQKKLKWLEQRLRFLVHDIKDFAQVAKDHAAKERSVTMKNWELGYASAYGNAANWLERIIEQEFPTPILHYAI